MTKRMIFLTIALMAVLVVPGLAGDDGMADGEIKTIPVSGAVHMLHSGGAGNVGVSVGEDGVLIIDDKFEPLADKIKSAIAELSSAQLKFVLNTHWHGDHTGGNEVFGKEALIVAHDNVRKRLMTRQEVELFNMVSEPKPEEALPVVTFDESLSIHFNGEEIQVMHFPNGHTDGDSVIYFTKSNVVHMGDHFFNGMYPFVDVNSGGNVKGMIDNIGKVLEMVPADAKVIPGHGPLATVEDLRKFRTMLQKTSTIVQNAMTEGKTLEEIQAAGFPNEINDIWGNGFLNADTWIGIIFESHSQ